VQFVRGKGFQFVTCHAWTLSHGRPFEAAVHAQPGRAELPLLV